MGYMKTRLLLFALLLGGLFQACDNDRAEDSQPKAGAGLTENTADTLYYLAMGDSYTYGEGVAANERFPERLQARLNQNHSDSLLMHRPTVIAKTGWTASELLQEAAGHPMEDAPYDLVTLLIGANNQYQRLPFSAFERDYEALLELAVARAGGDTSQVVLLSIPDYTYTPFGQNLNDPDQVRAELSKYNGYIKNQAEAYGMVYMNITPLSRQGLADSGLIAADGLHPSGKMYESWVNLMLSKVEEVLSLQ